MVKNTNLGRVEADFNEKLVNYANLIGLSKIELIEELFYKEIQDKVLTNTFISIEELYYFNFIELQKNKTVKASKIRPTTDLAEVFIIKKIPNNLDVFDKANRTFCSNGVPEKHIGLYSYNRFVINEIRAKDSQLFQYYLLFEFDSGTEELTVTLTSVEDVFLMLDVNNMEVIISDLAEFNKVFSEAIDRVKKAPEEATIRDVITGTEEYINLGTYLTSMLVIEPLTNAKSFSYNMLVNNPEDYERIIKNSSSDLILFKDIVEKEEGVNLITVKANEEGGSNNG